LLRWLSCFRTTMPTHPPIPPNASDSELLQRLHDRDERAYKVLYDRYFPDLYRQAMFKLNGDGEAAEEVLQQVFVAFWVQEKWAVVKDNLKGYLAKMVHFKAAGYIRDNVRTRGNIQQYRDQVIFGTEPTIQSDQTELEAKESAQEADALIQALHAEINNLPEQCRKVFTEVYLNEKKYAQVAEEFGISINTVKDYMKVGMRKLRAKLAGLPIVSLVLLIGLTIAALRFFAFLPTLIHQLNDC
jgi:RNA polymerase sigma factor (sigma-70 family)